MRFIVTEQGEVKLFDMQLLKRRRFYDHARARIREAFEHDIGDLQFVLPQSFAITKKFPGVEWRKRSKRQSKLGNQSLRDDLLREILDEQ